MVKKLHITLVLPVLLIMLGLLSGCELAKLAIGKSTRHLENARSDSISKIYRCTFDDCFDSVLSLSRDAKSKENELMEEEELEELEGLDGKEDEEALIPVDAGYFDIFTEDYVNSRIVVMGVPGNINTTEVGIFFSEYGDDTIKIEITSLSSSAKRKVADSVFKELGTIFTEVR